MSGREFPLAAALCAALLAAGPVLAQQPPQPAPQPPSQPVEASGGPLLPEQAAYDVTFYDLALRVNPTDSTIAGALAVYARVVIPMGRLVLDLDTVFAVTGVFAAAWNDAAAAGRQPTGRGQQASASPGAALPFERRGGRLWITLPRTLQPGERVAARVEYHGRPRTGGFGPFSWSHTAAGQPWLGVAVETIGADAWWPCKDHPSDETDSMVLHFTVPAPLVAVSNGKLRGVHDDADGTRTYDWFVSMPINNYGVTLDVAPYVQVTERYVSVAGDTMPVTFWALPEDSANARAHMSEFLDHLRFYEELGGPYPFRSDKYGIVETPFLGMEHQTLIAYGAGFRNDAMARYDWGFDGLHQHELGHEWFGNMITPPDWNDLWLHEGFAQYMQPLYAERRIGVAKARDIMAMARSRIRTANLLAIAPRETQNSRQAYARDVYWRGSWVLHSLRYVMGSERFFTLLHQWADPQPPLPFINDRCRCRFATTDDLLRLASRIAGADLSWFFEVYVRQAELPRLVMDRQGTTVELRWEAPAGLPFPMPVDVKVDGRTRRVEMPGGHATLAVGARASVELDPDNWVLRAGP
jgi:aminopeptidase N